MGRKKKPEITEGKLEKINNKEKDSRRYNVSEGFYYILGLVLALVLIFATEELLSTVNYLFVVIFSIIAVIRIIGFIMDKEYIKRKYAAVLEKTEEIDELINANAKGWKTTRMNKVDLSILRLAVYEMKWDDEVPVGVAINEAVELAKMFSSDEAPSFINGVLGKIARSLEETKE